MNEQRGLMKKCRHKNKIKDIRFEYRLTIYLGETDKNTSKIQKKNPNTSSYELDIHLNTISLMQPWHSGAITAITKKGSQQMINAPVTIANVFAA